MPSERLQLRAEGGDLRAQVALAAALDEEGRHEQAIDWLARAGKTGDGEALRILGLRLLTGENAPHLPAQGARMLADAARAGDAGAAAVASVLLGGGFFAPQNWRIALDYLRMAAELGDPDAREQLLLLAGDAALARQVRGGAEVDEPWRRLRESIDMADWTRAPEPKVLNAEPLARSFQGLIPPEVCDYIVARSQPRLVRAEVHDPETGLTIMGATRTNRVANFGLTETSLLNLLVQSRISAASGAPVAAMEAFAVLHYGVGEEASEHFDFLDPGIPAYGAEIAQLGQRIMTCLIYLNEGYEGGETAFPALGLDHRGGKGDALVFSSVDLRGAPDPRSLHAGRPPTSGEKWVLSQFIRSKAIAPGA